MLSAAAVTADFAGHYGVNTWGCGSECIQIGIVNLRNGKVYMPGVMANVGVEFRPNSRLIIVNPPAKLKEGVGDVRPPADYLQTEYYLWDGSRMRLIYPTELKGKIQEPLKSCPP
jgi:hypothetical protein